jgi:NADH-quinone oxidoreductase subunit L
VVTLHRQPPGRNPGPPGARFLLNGWYLDNLYAVLIIKPFKLLARFFWKKGDETGIDGALDGLARLIARLGGLPADWSTGRVATSLFGLAGGVCVVLVYLVWVTLP